jgi:hypothetical protein
LFLVDIVFAGVDVNVHVAVIGFFLVVALTL